LFGERWLPTIPLIQVLAFAFLLRVSYLFYGILITAMGKPSWNLWRNSIETLIRVIVFCLVIRWGVVAMAIAAMLVLYLVTPIRVWMIHKLIYLNLAKYFRTYIVPLAGAVIMVFAILATQHFLSNWISLHMLLVLSIIVGVVFYSGVLLLISPKLIYQTFESARLAVILGIRKGYEHPKIT